MGLKIILALFQKKNTIMAITFGYDLHNTTNICSSYCHLQYF